MSNYANGKTVRGLCGSMADMSVDHPWEEGTVKSFCCVCGFLGHRASDCQSGPKTQVDITSCSPSASISSANLEGPELDSERMSQARPPVSAVLSDNRCFFDKTRKTAKKKNPPRNKKFPTHEDLEELYRRGMTSRNPVGTNFARYSKHTVWLSDPKFYEKDVNTFEELGIHSDIVKMVNKLGYQKPTPIQAAAVRIINSGQNLVASAQTGCGKTAAFLLPLLNNIAERDTRNVRGLPQTPKALILAPTRELAQQIFDDATKFSARLDLKIGLCHGRTSFKSELDRISAGSHIIIGTLGRILDHLGQNVFSLKLLRHLVFDEADRILANDFSDTTLTLLELVEQSKSLPQYIFFSATNTDSILTKTKRFVGDCVVLRVGIVGTVNEDVDQKVIEVPERSKLSQLMHLLQAELRLTSTSPKILVFVNTKERAERVSRELANHRISSQMLQSDMDQTERNQALSDFERGVCPVLVATLLASRGLDMTLVSHVINYDLPHNIDEYVNCVGRTGRAGNSGTATSFFDPNSENDISLAPALRIKMQEAGQTDIPDFL